MKGSEVLYCATPLWTKWGGGGGGRVIIKRTTEGLIRPVGLKEEQVCAIRAEVGRQIKLTLFPYTYIFLIVNSEMYYGQFISLSYFSFKKAKSKS